MRMISTLAVISALAFAPAAYAQVSTDAAAAGNVGAAVTGSSNGSSTSVGGNVNVDANAAASVSSDKGNAGDASYGTVISALNSANGSVDLSGVTSDTDVRIVLVSSLKGQASANAQALDEALQKNASARAQLQADIEANETLKAKLTGEGVDLQNVVAITSSVDGTLTVIVDDRQS